MSGPLRGARWVVGSHTHGCWLGTYEPEKQASVRRFTKPGSVFYDLGANVGFFSLMAARLGARVVAVEPLPRNLTYLRRHVALNRCSSIDLFEGVVSDRPGHLRLTIDGPATSHIGDDGPSIRATTLDEMAASLGYPPPDVIKCDVEGAEARVLEGGREILAGRRPVWLLSVHSPQLRDECVQRLTSVGYRIETEGGDPHELIAVATGYGTN
jgi:FkbM family methyltransferase